MALFNEEIKQQVEERLAELGGDVRLVMFTRDGDCQFCEETQQMVEEVAGLSDNVTAEVYDLAADEAEAESYGVDKAPAIAVVGADDYGVRFYGIPSGYEFASLLQAMELVASGEAGLADATVEALGRVDEPIHMQVFVTPTCPYCPGAVNLAHQMAVASPQVRADMVEAMEFQELSTQYQVQGVPRTVINETVHIEGAVPESAVLEGLAQALAS